MNDLLCLPVVMGNNVAAKNTLMNLSSFHARIIKVAWTWATETFAVQIRIKLFPASVAVKILT